jgi:putative sterol carrier protein
METTNNAALGDCLRAFQKTFNGNEQVKKLIKGWNRSLVLKATDTGAGLTVIVNDLMVTDVNEGARDEDDDDETIHLQASEDTLVRIFSGDYNPANALIDGELAVFSSEKDKVKLEAISIVIWGM